MFWSEEEFILLINLYFKVLTYGIDKKNNVIANLGHFFLYRNKKLGITCEGQLQNINMIKATLSNLPHLLVTRDDKWEDIGETEKKLLLLYRHDKQAFNYKLNNILNRYHLDSNYNVIDSNQDVLQWDDSEVTLLIDLYEKTLKVDSGKRWFLEDNLLRNLSKVLANRFAEIKNDKDKNLRSKDKLKNKLENIKYLVTGGDIGKETYSEVDIFAYSLYRDNKKLFEKHVIDVLEDYTIDGNYQQLDKITKYVNWDIDEVILLLDLYLKYKEPNEKQVAIDGLSKFLRYRAKTLGYKIDETFRNATGINMKLKNIQYLFTDGKVGLSSYSAMDKKVVHLYQYNRYDYENKLIELKSKYGLDSMYRFTDTIKKIEFNQNCEKEDNNKLSINHTANVLDKVRNYIESNNDDNEFGVIASKESINQHYILYYGEKILYISPNFISITIQDADKLEVQYEKKGYNHPFKAKLHEKYYSDINQLMQKLVQLHHINIDNAKAKNNDDFIIDDDKDYLDSEVSGNKKKISIENGPADSDITNIPHLNIEVEDLELSVRSTRALRRANIISVGKLLSLTEEDLFKIKNLGQKSIEEILAKIEEIKENDEFLNKIVEEKKTKQTEFYNVQNPNIENDSTDSDITHIPHLNIEVEDLELSVRSTRALRRAQILTVEKFLSLRERDLLKIRNLGKKSISEIIAKIKEIKENGAFLNKIVEAKRAELSNTHKLANHLESTTFSDIESLRRELLYQCSLVPNARKKQSLKNYVDIWADGNNDKLRIAGLLTEFRDILDLENNITGFLENMEDCAERKLLCEFLEWLNFDTEKIVANMVSTIFKNDRDEKVIRLRASGATLEKAGNALGITRERIRQIEKKVISRFRAWNNKNNILQLIYLDFKSQNVIRFCEIEKMLPNYGCELVYLLCQTNRINFTCDKEHKVFYYAKEIDSNCLKETIKKLPDIIFEHDWKTTICKVMRETCLSEDIVKQDLELFYTLTGKVYHRGRLTKTFVIESVLHKYFQNGMKIADKNTMKMFREFVDKDFGDIGLPINDRAMEARISSIGILSGRGTYKPKKTYYIPEELAKKIYNYIMHSENSIFLMNTIFSIFKKDLAIYGIDNKYYLQGVLHELYGDKFVFRRDYISKDDSFTSFYNDVAKFIKTFIYPVEKKQIYQRYPGITEIVINCSVNDDPSILNFFGQYLHASRLKINSEDINYLRTVVNNFVGKKEMAHCKEIFEYIDLDNPYLLKKTYALYAFSLFSILEYLFREDYQFKRPYVALKSVEIGKPIERLNELVRSSDEISIADIVDFSKENYYIVYNILDLINSFSDTHLLIDENFIASIEHIGLNESDIVEIEEKILSEINECTPIVDLTCIHSFRKINVDWNEWLIYSIIKKWSNRLEVATTSSQFRMSIPVIAPVGMINEYVLKQYDNSKKSSFVQIDNLDNIDHLISDYIEDELDEWGEV